MIIYKDLHSYHIALIKILNAVVSEKNADNRLSTREVEILAYCCDYAKLGLPLDNFTKLCNYIVKDVKALPDKRTMSMYKTMFAQKQWIKGGRDVFILNKVLLDDKISITIEYERGSDKVQS